MEEKPYRSLNEYYRSIFGRKAAKISLDGGFTCPNRDGTCGTRGCLFCSAGGSGDFAENAALSITAQIAKGKAQTAGKWKNPAYIAYFQAFSNTHAPLEVLKRKYEAVLECDPNIVALSIGTRPDCLPDDVVDYLGELNKEVDLWVELGLQSMHDKTGKLINRGHDYQTLVEGVNKLRAKNIDVIIHIINGLPGETHEMMLETAKAVAGLDVQGIKIHLLHVIEGTPMHKMLDKGMLTLMEKDEYIDLVVDQLEILPPEMVIHRLTGDAVREELVGPMWSLKKWEVLNDIDKTLKERDTYQGIYYNKK